MVAKDNTDAVMRKISCQRRESNPDSSTLQIVAYRYTVYSVMERILDENINVYKKRNRKAFRP
jgi:hypothetical protein